MKKKPQKHNHLVAELSAGENYNIIDGIINNTPKPSVMEKIREYESRITKNVNVDTEADGNKPELSHSAREEL